MNETADRKKLKQFVMDHALPGALVLIPDSDGHIARAQYYPKGQPGSSTVIDEKHPLGVDTLSGVRIPIRMSKGQLFFGKAVAMDNSLYGSLDGYVIEVNRCGDFSG